MPAGIFKEVWVADIKEKLFPEDSFMLQSVDDTPFADNRTVHRANAGANPGWKRNRQTVPAQIVVRQDEDASYDLDEITSDPTLIRDIEEVETAYDKRQSVLRSHINTLNLGSANWMQFRWAPTASANIILTSGGARPAVGTAYGATGNRKKLALAEIFKLAVLFDDMDVPQEGRNLLLPAAFYHDLVEDKWDALLQLQTEGSAVLKDGALLRLHRFNIFTRGKKNLLTYTNGTGTVRPPDAAPATGVRVAALAWHRDFVSCAKGEVKVFDNIDDATMYGSVFSALARTGGRPMYNDQTGIAAIVEDNA